NKNVLKNIGAFGGFFKFPAEAYRKPVLVASTDGVGTKLKVAVLMNKHRTVGQDLVNHCINDIAVCGARPLFFLDYFACGKLDERVYRQIIQGFVEACRKAQLPLIGGETAEMPDLYRAEDYDLAGTIVGVVEQEEIIDGSRIQEKDVMIGVASNGLHTNGYSLARKVLFANYAPGDFVPELNNTLGDELLKIHINYFPLIHQLTQNFDVKGIAHITGGGLYKNTLRIIPKGLIPNFYWNSWDRPPIFRLIQQTGNVPEEDMRQTFNLGIGLVFILERNKQKKLLNYVKNFEQDFYRIGEIVEK
ncbi:MAG TPA: phosphoribosylformylglycinamidine cyclo-ligase, partial [Caldithrix sp.]|nr:phosphoribosylformylglycinamidine cyclo-ligase [Caldithrix sp.]